MFYDITYPGQPRIDPREQYRIPGRHTSTIDNGVLTQSPYVYDQPQVEANLAAMQARRMQPPQAFEPPDPMETLAQRYRPSESYRDIIAGRTAAGTENLRFLDDPQFRSLSPEQQGALTQRLTGRTLAEQVEADEFVRRSGRPMTWQDIADYQYQQQQAPAALSRLRAFGQFMGERELGDVLMNYDPQTYRAQVGGGVDKMGMPIPSRDVWLEPQSVQQIEKWWRLAGLPALRVRRVGEDMARMGMGDRLAAEQINPELDELEMLRAKREAERDTMPRNRSEAAARASSPYR